MMPDLSGMTAAEAKHLITGQNLLLLENGIIEEYSDVVEKGRVISQSIPAEERIAVQTEITLAVSLGSLNEETALLKVPDLTGMTKEKAVKTLGKLKEQAGFTYVLGEVKNKYSTDIKKGKIMSQSPKAGLAVRTNEPICIVISKGPEMVQMPELVYLTKDQAVAKLEKAGLHIEIKTEYSEKAASGLVTAQSAKTGSKVAKGSVVVITVSLGKAPVQPGSGNAGNTGNSGSSGSSAGNSGSSGGSTGSSGSSGDGAGNGSGKPSGGNAGNSGSAGSSGQPQPGSAGSGDADGNKAIMPDGGSFVVE